MYKNYKNDFHFEVYFFACKLIYVLRSFLLYMQHEKKKTN